MIYKYYPKGVCSREFIFEIEGDIIKDAKIIGGCQGNTARYIFFNKRDENN